MDLVLDNRGGHQSHGSSIEAAAWSQSMVRKHASEIEVAGEQAPLEDGGK